MSDLHNLAHSQGELVRQLGLQPLFHLPPHRGTVVRHGWCSVETDLCKLLHWPAEVGLLVPVPAAGEAGLSRGQYSAAVVSGGYLK